MKRVCAFFCKLINLICLKLLKPIGLIVELLPFRKLVQLFVFFFFFFSFFFFSFLFLVTDGYQNGPEKTVWNLEIIRSNEYFIGLN